MGTQNPGFGYLPVPPLLCIFTFSATIGAFSLGTVLGWSSPATPFLVDCNEIGGNDTSKQDCTLPKSFSEEEGSWISSSVNFGMLFGAIMAGIDMGRAETCTFVEKCNNF